MFPLTYQVDDHVGPDLSTLLDLRNQKQEPHIEQWTDVPATSGWPPVPLAAALLDQSRKCPQYTVQSAPRGRLGLKDRIGHWLIRTGQTMLGADQAL